MTIQKQAEWIQLLLERAQHCSDLDEATKDLCEARDYLAKIHGEVIKVELQLRAKKNTLPEDTIDYLDRLITKAM